MVAGPPSSSVLDDVTLPAEQSSKPRGKDTAQGNDNQTGRDSQSFVRMCNIYPENIMCDLRVRIVFTADFSPQLIYDMSVLQGTLST